MVKHRAFNGDRFLDKFQGREDILVSYIESWGTGLDIDATNLDIARFKQFLLMGTGSLKNEFMEGLYRAYDLATDQGYEDLIAACRDLKFRTDPSGRLPMECLSLKVRTENETAFNLAYDRCALQKAERFTVFQGEPGRIIEDAARATERLQERLAEMFKDDKNTDRVLVRHYQEGAYTNFIVYHEKRTTAVLVFQARRKIAPTVLCPVQQDFISYNGETGQLEIEARFPREEAALRRAFAECCFGDAEMFEQPEARQTFSLNALEQEDFDLAVDEGDGAELVELQCLLPQMHDPTITLKSKNVGATLDLTDLKKQLLGATIRKAVFKIRFSDDCRGKRVELIGTNKISFKRATHAEDVFRYLKKWRILCV
jgi:hypothetical protein